MDNSQVKMLNLVQESGMFDYSDVSSEEIDILRFLSQKKLIRHKYNHSSQKPCYVITELGKQALHSESKDNTRFWIPIIISNLMSLIAIIISIIALLK